MWIRTADIQFDREGYRWKTPLDSLCYACMKDASKPLVAEGYNDDEQENNENNAEELNNSEGDEKQVDNIEDDEKQLFYIENDGGERDYKEELTKPWSQQG